MQHYTKELEIRWADLDPNFHVLHSKYYDFGAYCRMSFFSENGITVEALQEYHIGPIILREECIFKKEIRFGDTISVSLFLRKLTTGCRRWTLYHELWKNGDILAAQITLDGAWMDTRTRKLAIPPDKFSACFDAIPRTADFTHIP